MRILILSCGTGGGHNSAGRAMAETFQAHGDEVFFPDYLSLADEKVSKIVTGTYIDMARLTPRLFGGMYKIGMAVSKISHSSPVYQANKLMAKYLRAYLNEHPVDAVVMPHLYPAETLTWMKRSGDALPVTFAIATDYTCVPFWEETDCDFYVVPSEALSGEFVERGVPAGKVLPLGIPVSSAYRQPTTRAEARAALSLPAEGNCILVMGGSMGAGSLIDLTRCLLAQDETAHIIVIAGSNERTAAALHELPDPAGRLTILSFTKQVPLYFRACDLLFSKPGGLTSTEAAVSGIPLIHTDPIPGCETVNREYFESRGMSLSARTPEEQVQAGLRILHDPALRDAMLQNQHKGIHPDAADRIYDAVKAAVERRNA